MGTRRTVRDCWKSSPITVCYALLIVAALAVFLFSGTVVAGYVVSVVTMGLPLALVGDYLRASEEVRVCRGCGRRNSRDVDLCEGCGKPLHDARQQ